MPTLVNYSGDENLCHGGSIFSTLMDTSLLLSLGSHVDVYYPPLKRSRVTAPFVFNGDMFRKTKQVSIDVLPDECFFEIFRRLPSGQERSACASVSKRWLMLLSSISKDEVCSNESAQSIIEVVSDKIDESSKLNKQSEFASKDNETIIEEKTEDIECDGYLTRSLEGKKATDIRLASIAVGTGSRGGLGKLIIRGSNSTRGVTNIGLSAVARGCPSLRALSLWNVPSIGDEGLIEIAKGCNKLEKLDLCQCPISDKSLFAIANNCPNLSQITIESCPMIGNEGLQAIGKCCLNLQSIAIKDCPLVGDQGLTSLLSSASYTLKRVRLQALDITDISLAVVGHYGRAIDDLVLTGLQKVSEKGFWVMGNAQGLQKLKVFTITSCRGVTDLALEAVGKGCPNLKQLCLRKCSFLSDNGMAAFAKTVASLENLQLEECNRITQSGVLSALSNIRSQLKVLSVVKCMGIRDMVSDFVSLSPCKSLRSLTIRDCPGFGSASLAMVGRLCPQLQHIDLSGLSGVTDAGFYPLLENSETGLVKVNLNGCIGITDAAVSTMVRLHGTTLQLLSLDGCKNVTDAGLFAIAVNCSVLQDLDVSKCTVTDRGVAALSCAKELQLQILSLSGCSQVSDESVPYLNNMGQNLVGLNLQHCNAMSCSKIDQLVGNLWRCDILA
ncbi:Ein3-binding f-box protein [Thalictrum thalictroides]|uniref:Ein3-binding f-box protein n=1 Tax=Thalictrum thalictroides TaxID=46969 RepID=A0A7J6WIU9_THATH|nr:Ein3-binding f-box protein [Thalictrum thalictroides]